MKYNNTLEGENIDILVSSKRSRNDLKHKRTVSFADDIYTSNFKRQSEKSSETYI